MLGACHERFCVLTIEGCNSTCRDSLNLYPHHIAASKQHLPWTTIGMWVDYYGDLLAHWETRT